MGEMMGGMAVGMIVWALVGIAALMLAVLGIVWLVRNLSNGSPQRPAVDSAEQLLRRRYAAGEIDDDEYVRRASRLSRN